MILRQPEVVRLEVTDGSPQHPVLFQQFPPARSGRDCTWRAR
ncbi:hypothetical protein [Streptomyces sp. GESEQ-4]|nr:hypothetical protein [Streptomyces sp. GESEQ-4]